MRLFIAIDVPQEAAAHLRELQRSLDRCARMTLPRDFHMTLAFLGDVEEAQLEHVKSLLATVRFERFGAWLTRAGVFPREGAVKVVWVGLGPEDRLRALQQAIAHALVGIDDVHGFVPHITLARVKAVEDTVRFLQGVKALGVRPIRFWIDTFTLYKSTLTPDGPVHEAVAAFHA